MMLLVTGASGVGKSTVRRLIAEELEPEVRAVELTQIAGPPTYQRGWRQRAVEQVVQVAVAEQERRLRERGDPEDLIPHHLAFAEWMRAHARDPHHRLEVIDAGWEEMRWERLPKTWKVAEIDVTEMSPAEAADRVLAWCGEGLG
jgi:broad-specificity NMP kinase